MLATLMLAAALQVSSPTSPATKPGQTIAREVVIRKSGDAKPDQKSNEEGREIIVIRDGKDGSAAAKHGPERRIRVVEVGPGKNGERREVRILREIGAPGARITMTSCDDVAKFDSEATDKDRSKTRVMFCVTGGSSNVSKVQQLRDAAKRIEGNENLSPETRARIIASINEAIAKLPVSE